ncbi:MAG: tRNA (guanosine(46)-N7)-methyltransferase TrmB [Prochlorococcus sp.]|nr:tRNA (guanosine(46)-N7)-methyltransferase TrmB [Prochlorococcus sp.]
MRQHVNPLSRFFQLPRELAKPAELFAQSDQPLHLDIGSARGMFLLELAALQPEWNHLGVEIRLPLVLAAEKDREQRQLRNLSFLFCNANVSLESWLAALPKGQLHRASIQFPDPWFKRRHQKRRVLQPRLLIALAAALEPGRELFIQSDVLPVIEPMLLLVEQSNCFERPEGNLSPWLDTNPLPVRTERERYVRQQGLPIYRRLYQRNQQPLPDLSSLEAAWQQIDNPENGDQS